MNTTVKNMNNTAVESTQLEKSFAGHLSGEGFFDEHRRGIYSTDASIYRIMPLAVIVPKDLDDVVLTVNVARELGLSVIPRGSGTSLSGQSVGPGIVIDFSRYFNQILHIDPENRVARVQPGVVLDQINAATSQFGLQFGPDVATSSRANLGGMMGNNSAGARSTWYGKTVDHVRRLQVVLSDAEVSTFESLDAKQLADRQASPGVEGQVHREIQRIVGEFRQDVIDRYPRVLRRVSGYNLDEFIPEVLQTTTMAPVARQLRQKDHEAKPDAVMNLAKLLVGAEGTLGVITEAEVHLTTLPKSRGLVVLQYESMPSAVASLTTILSLEPSAAELFDGMILQLAEKNLQYRNYLDFVQGNPESLMLVEFSGSSDEEVREKVDVLQRHLKGHPGLTDLLPALDPEKYAHVWACRKAALPLLMSVPGARKPIAFVEDTAVDPSKLSDFVDRFRHIVEQEETYGAFYGHASVGCLHIRPLLDTACKDDLQRLERISRSVCDLVMEFGGTMSAEHGDGLARSYLLEKTFGPRLYQAFREVKTAFDPEGIMNPGKIVDAPGPTENLRYGENYTTREVKTKLDFSKEGGLARAAELCNGAGVCRKLQTGTMCPSFMATGEEQHGTRGRANALRLALSGKASPEMLTGPRIRETFDLCLQCKGCKAECPSNVDVAKMKVELMHQYHLEHGIPWSTRVMGHVYRVNQLGSFLAPVSNWMARLPGAAYLAEKSMGIDRRRPLPTFTREHFRKWFSKRTDSLTPGNKDVVLLDDCLTSYCEPGVNRAAVRVLEATGHRVHLAGLECCGRALFSKGLLDDAEQLARHNIAKLASWARRGVPIVGCEPSCLLTMLDEYLDLIPGEDTRSVAEHSHMIDSYLLGMKLPDLREDDQSVMLHGHCHQKALLGVDHTRQFVELVPGSQCHIVDSGCCGMAGSFGYEHYDVSMKIGQRVLFPAVRKHTGTVLAPGFSCRHQIHHGTLTQALHPIEWVAQHLPT